MTRIILASQSPRRRELLTKMGVDFEVQPSNYDEHLDETRDVKAVAMELALGKAEDVAKSNPDAFVIGSDTIVAIDGRQLGKAVDVDEARDMLVALAGRESAVCTGVALVNHARAIKLVDADVAKVYFKPDSKEVVRLREDYLASNDWRDKAGAYGIQSGAAPLIDKIEGDYDTIVGLSTRILADMLSQVGITSDIVAEQSPVLHVHANER